MNTLAFIEMDFHCEFADGDRLRAAAEEIDLYAARLFIVNRQVLKGARVEVSAELMINLHEQIEIEGGGHTERIVVGRFEDVRALAQVRAQEERVACTHHAAQGAQESVRFVRVEVSDVRA